MPIHPNDGDVIKVLDWTFCGTAYPNETCHQDTNDRS